MHKALHPRDDIDCMREEKKEEETPNIEDSVDT